MPRTEKLRQSEIMLRAGQAGESAKQRAHEGRMSTRQQEKGRTESARQFDEGIEQSNLNRWQRQWEQRRAERERRDAERVRTQASKPRTTMFGTEGQDPNAPPSVEQQRLDESKRQFDVSTQQKQQQFETSTELSAAKSGLQAAGGDRLGALQAEMQQRGAQQMGQSLEQTGRRGFVSTPEAKQEKRREAGLEEREMRVKEMNARSTKTRARAAYNRLDAEEKAATTKAAKVEIQRKQKLVEQTLTQYVISDADRLDRFMKGDQTITDEQALRKMLEKHPPVGTALELHEEVNTGQFGEATARFLSAKVDASAIEFIFATGKMPDGKLVDFSSVGMQEFSRRAREARYLLQPGSVAAKMMELGVQNQITKKEIEQIRTGYRDKLVMINKLGALLVMKQQAGLVSPAMGQEQEPKYEQRRADSTKPFTPAERAGQITPEEAGRKAEEAGGVAAPKTGKKPYEPPAPSKPMGTRGGISGNLPYGV